MLPSCTPHPQRKNFDFSTIKNSDLCWNDFTHAQLLNIRILVEFCISGIHCANSFNSCELNSTLAILPILSISMRLPDGDKSMLHSSEASDGDIAKISSLRIYI